MHKDLVLLASTINKSLGEGSCSLLGQDSSVRANNIKRLKTGIMSVDIATGGGLVPGITEVQGHESHGKTTFAINLMAQAQKDGHAVAIIDAEHALNLEYAKKLGLNTDEVLIAQPSSGEDALEIARKIVESGLVKVLIIDSVAALVPQAELMGDFTDASIGAQARLMSKMCRILVPLLSKYGVYLILINQIRMKIGVLFGSPETTPGGKAIPFFSQIRLRVHSSKDDSLPDYRVLTFTCIKNKWGVPYQKAEAFLRLGEGFDVGYDRLIALKANGRVTLKGSSYYLDNKLIGSGKKAAAESLAKMEF